MFPKSLTARALQILFFFLSRLKILFFFLVYLVFIGYDVGMAEDRGRNMQSAYSFSLHRLPVLDLVRVQYWHIRYRYRRYSQVPYRRRGTVVSTQPYGRYWYGTSIYTGTGTLPVGQ